MNDLISRQAAIDAIWTHETKILESSDYDALTRDVYKMAHRHIVELIQNLPPAQPEEVTPHNNLGVRTFHSDFWCTCGWYLGKKGVVRYCPNCGKKVKWRNSR